MTLTVFDNIEQRSEQWFAARRGIITASAVDKLIANAAPEPITVDCGTCPAMAGSPCLSMAKRKEPSAIKTFHPERIAFAASLPPEPTLADNDTSRRIVNILAAERLAGFTEDTPMTADMWRGVEQEKYARDHYSGHYQQAVECGFMRRDEDGWTLGLSPDGLVADDGGLELKCPRAATHVAWTIADKVPAQHMAQVQAALLVSGRAWWDFASFVGGLPLFVKRVYPDPMWFAAIEQACRAFETAVTDRVGDYHTKTKGLPNTERVQPLTDLEFTA